MYVCTYVVLHVAGSFVQVGYVKAEAVQVVQMLLRKYPQWRTEVLPSLQRSVRSGRVEGVVWLHGSLWFNSIL